MRHDVADAVTYFKKISLRPLLPPSLITFCFRTINKTIVLFLVFSVKEERKRKGERTWERKGQNGQWRRWTREEKVGEETTRKRRRLSGGMDEWISQILPEMTEKTSISVKCQHFSCYFIFGFILTMHCIWPALLYGIV